jgi:hypothetical protein
MLSACLSSETSSGKPNLQLWVCLGCTLLLTSRASTMPGMSPTLRHTHTCSATPTHMHSLTYHTATCMLLHTAHICPCRQMVTNAHIHLQNHMDTHLNACCTGVNTHSHLNVLCTCMEASNTQTSGYSLTTFACTHAHSCAHTHTHTHMHPNTSCTCMNTCSPI